MRSEAVSPMEVTYNVLIRLAGLAGRWATALELLAQMKEQQLSPTLYHYNNAFLAFESGQRWREALSLFRKLQDEGIKPNPLTYMPLIGVLDKSKKRQQARAAV
ncbi:unnamed protein product, partial [Discosporangium mesarthrocarpum]